MGAAPPSKLQYNQHHLYHQRNFQEGVEGQQRHEHLARRPQQQLDQQHHRSFDPYRRKKAFRFKRHTVPSSKTRLSIIDDGPSTEGCLDDVKLKRSRVSPLSASALQKLVWLRDWQRVLIRIGLYPEELKEWWYVPVFATNSTADSVGALERHEVEVEQTGTAGRVGSRRRKENSNNNNPAASHRSSSSSTTTAATTTTTAVSWLKMLPLHLICALHPPVEVVRLCLKHFAEAAACRVPQPTGTQPSLGAGGTHIQNSHNNAKVRFKAAETSAPTATTSIATLTTTATTTGFSKNTNKSSTYGRPPGNRFRPNSMNRRWELWRRGGRHQQRGGGQFCIMSEGHQDGMGVGCFIGQKTNATDADDDGKQLDALLISSAGILSRSLSQSSSSPRSSSCLSSSSVSSGAQYEDELSAYYTAVEHQDQGGQTIRPTSSLTSLESGKDEDDGDHFQGRDDTGDDGGLGKPTVDCAAVCNVPRCDDVNDAASAAAGSSSSQSASSTHKYGLNDDDDHDDRSDMILQLTSSGGLESLPLTKMNSNVSRSDSEHRTVVPFQNSEMKKGRSMQKKNGPPPSHVSSTLSWSLWDDWEPVLFEYVSQYGRLLPLHVACLYQASPDVVNALLDAFPPAALSDIMGMIPLHWMAAGWVSAPLLQGPLSPPFTSLLSDDPPNSPLTDLTEEAGNLNEIFRVRGEEEGVPSKDSRAAVVEVAAITETRDRYVSLELLSVLKSAMPHSINVPSSNHGMIAAEYAAVCLREGPHKRACLALLEPNADSQGRPENKRGVADDSARNDDDSDDDTSVVFADTTSDTSSLGKIFPSSSSSSSLDLSVLRQQQNGNGPVPQTTGGEGRDSDSGQLVSASLGTLMTQARWEEALSFLEDDPSCARRWLYGVSDHHNVNSKERMNQKMTNSISSNKDQRSQDVHIGTKVCHEIGYDPDVDPNENNNDNEDNNDENSKDKKFTLLPSPTSVLSTLSSSSMFQPIIWKRLAIHLACAANAPVGLVSFLIKSNPESVGCPDPHSGSLPLHLSCQSRHSKLAIVHMLLEANPDATQMMDVDGRLPLHVAVLCEAPYAIIEALLDVHVDAVSVIDAYGSTPMDYAHAVYGREHVVVALLTTISILLEEDDIESLPMSSAASTTSL